MTTGSRAGAPLRPFTKLVGSATLPLGRSPLAPGTEPLLGILTLPDGPEEVLRGLQRRRHAHRLDAVVDHRLAGADDQGSVPTDDVRQGQGLVEEPLERYQAVDEPDLVGPPGRQG